MDTGNKNEIKVAAMLQLQRQNVVTTPQQRHISLPYLKLDCYDNK